MPRESKKARRERAAEVYDLLAEEYPEAHCELDFVDPFQLGVATILSAQTTDERVNMVTPELFARFPDARALAGASQEEVEEIVRSTGFYRNKAKNIIGFARGLVEEHDGEVPATMEALNVLPGVGRKTANVILGNAFGVDEGVVVDTHVRRHGGVPAGPLDDALAPAHLARPARVRGPQAALRGVRRFTPVPLVARVGGRAG
jgi:endonuclease-3